MKIQQLAKLLPGHGLFWPLSVTCIFAIVICFERETATYQSDNFDQVSWSIMNIQQYIEKLRPEQGIKYIFYVWPLSVSFTFNIESKVLYATRVHIRVIISSKNHENTCEVMAMIRYKLQNNIFDL